MYTSQYDHNNDCNLLREYIAYNLFTTSILPPYGLWKYSRTNEINKRVNRVDKYLDAEESVSMRMIWNWKANVVRKKNNKNVTNFKQCKKGRKYDNTRILPRATKIVQCTRETHLYSLVIIIAKVNVIRSRNFAQNSGRFFRTFAYFATVERKSWQSVYN